MIVSAFAGVGKTTLAKKYMKDVIDLESGNFKWIGNGNTEATKGDNKRTQNPRYPINYLEAIKEANSKYKVVLISQHEVIRKCLDAVKLDYIIAYPDIQLKDEYIERYRHRGNNENFINLISREWNNWISALNDIEGHNKIVLKSGQFLEDYVVELGLEDRPVDNVHNSVDNYESDTENLSEKTENNTTKELTKQTQVQSKDITISNTLDSNFYIDDLTLRELKAVENNVRAGMLIQAKNRLQRVDRMLDVLNTLEDELFNRYEDDVANMRTSNIVEATKFISSLIADTNNLIMSVIGNPKLQNFFIVDNSSNINVEETGDLDATSRKKVRHAVQVVLDNIDKIEQGKAQEVSNPNIVIEAETIKEDIKDGDKST